MRQESLATFRDQAFRRIGYTVGLSNLLKLSDIVLMLREKGALYKRELVGRVMKDFELRTKDAEGKVDLASALGLLFAIGGRIAVTAHGKALTYLVKTTGPESLETRAFFLERVLVNDGDIFLPLFSAVLKGGGTEVEDLFLRILDQSLSEKRNVYTKEVKDVALRRELGSLLVVRESEPRPSPFAKQSKQSKYSSIEISDGALSHYARHTTTPRKGWLSDLGLVEGVRRRRTVTAAGMRLKAFLESTGHMLTELAFLEPDEDVLVDVVGKGNLLGTRAINTHFFEDLLSHTFTGNPPSTESVELIDFLNLVERIYGVVKLESFEQAELVAIREALMTPMLAHGKTIQFDTLLENAIKQFPNRVYRLSSRKKAGAYIAFKKHGA